MSAAPQPARRAGLRHALLREALRLFATSQAGPVVILQGAWMILAIATWGHAAGAGSDLAEAGRMLMRGYAWLGGTDEHGHGGGDRLLAVWARLSVLVYLLDIALRAILGERPLRPAWQWAALSGLVALLGMGVALWPTPQSLPEAAPLLLLYGTLAAGAAAWAVLVRRWLDRWWRHHERSTGTDTSAPP